LLPLTLLLLLHTYAVASKLSAFTLFRIALSRQPVPHAFAGVLLYALPGMEIITVFLLLCSSTLYTGLRLSLGLLSIFTGYIALVLLHWWPRTPCPCGGLLEHLSWKAHLLFNSACIALNLIAIYLHLKERRPQT